MNQGVGGFVEAMLAVVIVTSGMVLLTISLSILMTPDDGNDLKVECDRLLGSFLEEACMGSELLVDSKELCHFIPPPARTKGYTIMVMEVGGEPITVAQGGRDYIQGERWSLRQPLSLQLSPRNVRAAMLMVWVW